MIIPYIKLPADVIHSYCYAIAVSVWQDFVQIGLHHYKRCSNVPDSTSQKLLCQWEKDLSSDDTSDGTSAVCV